jgi:hypothetical protein
LFVLVPSFVSAVFELHRKMHPNRGEQLFAFFVVCSILVLVILNNDKNVNIKTLLFL